jgi:hypothetical protein
LIVRSLSIKIHLRLSIEYLVTSVLGILALVLLVLKH